jgi:HK97 family phage major capsid protein
MPDKTLLEQLREKRSEILNEMATAIEARQTARTEFEARTDATDEHRSTFAAAETAFGAEHEARKAELVKIDQRIDEQELIERRRADAASASRSDVSVTSEPLTYRADNAHERSYFRDLAATQVPAVAQALRGGYRDEAVERLQRHAAEMNVEMPKREAERERRARADVDRAERDATGNRGLATSPFEKRVNPNRTDGQGGNFIPPLWLVDDYIPLLRAHRVAAGLARQMDLPAGTDTIKIPKVATGSTVAMQTADGAAVSSTDLTDTSISASVVTAAGQQDVALQLIEQSPGQIFDQVVTEDLIADYNRTVDRQVILGTGANGQVLGILPVGNWTGASTVTYTQTTPATVDMIEVYGSMASQIATKRFSVENIHFLNHPRRWFWQASGVDTQNRAQVVPPQLGPVNVQALTDANEGAEGRVGQIPHLPNAGIYVDANMPVIATAAGAVTGGTSDLVLGAKWDDLWLFEGALRTRVLSEVLSGTLQIRFQAYSYIAFLVRYGESIAVAQGTGLAAPVGTKVASVSF